MFRLRSANVNSHCFPVSVDEPVNISVSKTLHDFTRTLAAKPIKLVRLNGAVT